MAQRYAHPQSRAWMSRMGCPACGKSSADHDNDIRPWFPRDCTLTPAGVRERITQYQADVAAEAGL